MKLATLHFFLEVRFKGRYIATVAFCTWWYFQWQIGRATYQSREYLLESVGKGCSQKINLGLGFRRSCGFDSLCQICQICQRLGPDVGTYSIWDWQRHPSVSPWPWILCVTCPVQIADLPGLLVVDSPMEDCPICLTELCPGENVWRLGKPFWFAKWPTTKRRIRPGWLGLLYISYMIFVSFWLIFLWGATTGWMWPYFPPILHWPLALPQSRLSTLQDWGRLDGTMGFYMVLLCKAMKVCKNHIIS